MNDRDIIEIVDWIIDDGVENTEDGSYQIYEEELLEVFDLDAVEFEKHILDIYDELLNRREVKKVTIVDNEDYFEYYDIEFYEAFY